MCTLEFFVCFMSHPLEGGGLWRIPQAATRGWSRCFGFTFGELSCRPSLCHIPLRLLSLEITDPRVWGFNWNAPPKSECCLGKSKGTSSPPTPKSTMAPDTFLQTCLDRWHLSYILSICMCFLHLQCFDLSRPENGNLSSILHFRKIKYRY